jgi:hypothetical protein
LDIIFIDNGIHEGIEIDVWDENGNHIGVLTVDFGARGWRNGGFCGWSSGESSKFCSSFSRSSQRGKHPAACICTETTAGMA